MNSYSLSSLLAFIGCYLLAFFVFLRGKSNPKAKAFIPTAIFAGTWCFFPFFSSLNLLDQDILLGVRIIYIAGLFTGPSFLLFGLTIAEVEKRPFERRLVFLSKICAAVLIPFLFTSLLIQGVKRYLPFFAIKPGPLYPLFIAFFAFVCLYSFASLLIVFPSTRGERKNQIKYVFLAYFIAFVSALIHFGSGYGVKETIPHDLLVFFTVIILTYTVIKFRFMDIRLAISNVAIFVFVYALVLGIPFYFYAIGLKFHALVMAIVLASGGPFIYGFIQRRAEHKIFEEQIHYQETLKMFSRGLLQKIYTMDHLTKIVCTFMRNQLGLTHAAFFVYHSADQIFFVEHKQGFDSDLYVKEISGDDLLIDALKAGDASITAEEVLVKQPGTKNLITRLRAEAFIPLIHGERIVGIIVLGKRQDGKAFTEGDLNAFNFLANQTTLAVEVCESMQTEVDRIKEEGQRARMNFLDGMVSTMAHEIDNPLNIIVGQTKILKLHLAAGAQNSEEYKIKMDSGLDKITETSYRISKIIRKVEEFAKGGGKIEPTDIYGSVDGFLMIQKLMQKQNPGVIFKSDIEQNLPLVLGDIVMIEEILANFCENAYHAVHRNEGEKKIVLKIFRLNDKCVRINFTDNGYGIDKNTIEKIFNVPTTTKGSSEGTGIGMYRVRQICNIFRAQYGISSDGKGKGASAWVDLTVALEKK
jgi:K+-sensing histidine kinase KdpD